MSLTYQDCLELKEAGFPQKMRNLVYKDEMTLPGLYSPTLEELIAECGDGLTMLENWGDSWSAYEERIDLIGKEARGKTPIQAVKNLYIALKK